MTARVGRTAGRARPQTGIALVVVLWVLALLTVVVSGFAFTMRTESQLVSNLTGQSRARAAAEAGLHFAIVQLSRPPAQRKLAVDGTPAEWRFGESVIRIAVQDTAGLVDMNTASPQLLKGILRAQGLEDGDVESLNDAIQDFRDGDEQKRLHGAEDDDYQDADRPYGAKDANFDALEELLQVLGMSPELYARLLPLVTLHSRETGVNPKLAPAAVLRAVPGVSLPVVEQYLLEREEYHAGDRTGPEPVPPALGAYASNKQGGSFHVNLRARTAAGELAVVQAILDSGGGPQRRGDDARRLQPAGGAAPGSLRIVSIDERGLSDTTLGNPDAIAGN